MAVAMADSFGEECVIPIQINNFYLGGGAKRITISVLEGGAREDDVFVGSDPFEDGFAHGCEPGSAVGVIERDTVGHFLDVGERMEGVSVGELPVELRGEHGADGGLAGTGRAHNDSDHGSLSRGLPSDLPEEFAEQHVEMVNTVFTFDGVAPPVVGGRTQTAL